MPRGMVWSQAGFVTYPDGTKGVLAAGGDEESTAYFLDMDTLVWEPLQSLPIDIHWGSSVPYRDSFLIVGGNSYDVGDYLDTVYYYNPTFDQWDLLDQRMSLPQERLAAFLVPDDYADCS